MVTILLIEDEPANLVAQSLILRSLGYMVLEARSPADAWHSWYEHQGPIDVVLMKAYPDRHGTTEFITRLQLLSPQIRALLVSDASSTELSETELSDMPSEYIVLRRPFRLDGLADAISGLLDAPKTRAFSSAY